MAGDIAKSSMKIQYLFELILKYVQEKNYSIQ